MKKMFFTAIALVAFTGISMANTKETKKSVTPIKAKTTKMVVVGTPCQEMMLDAYETIIEIRNNGEDWKLLNYLLSKC